MEILNTFYIRTVEIQYFCSDPHKDFISAPKEPETCGYVLNVNVHELCSIPSFGFLTEDAASVIQCFKQ